MKTRLVAYRKATSASTSDTTYQLDLQEEPNIPLNYQFSDIKNPESRKGSYSQTFKLPFTNNNNQFFQNWYNVNLESLVFDTRTKFDAVLYVGTVPQFEGILQLKAVYQKAQLYEVVLLSNSSSLFSVIGNKRLRDVFKNDDGSYVDDYNHLYTYTNYYTNTLYESWGSGLSNTSGDSLYDASAGVSKIVYPMSINRQNFYFNGAESTFLNMDQTTATAIVNDSDDGGVDAAWSKAVPFSQFKPAIQIRTLFRLIIARAGFTYTSDFIDGTGDYTDKFFAKLFMTTANYTGLPIPATTNTNAASSGIMFVAQSTPWGVYGNAFATAGEGNPVTLENIVVPADTTSIGTCSEYTDQDNIWNEAYNYFTRTDTTMDMIRVNHRVGFFNVQNSYGSNQGEFITLTYKLVKWNTTSNSSTDEVVDGSQTEMQVPLSINTTYGLPLTLGSDEPLNVYIPLDGLAPGESAQIMIDVEPCHYIDASNTNGPNFSLGTSMTVGCGTSYGRIEMNWAGFSNSVYGGTIDVPTCVDPEITQNAFLKDIIQRFNLVVLTDPSDASNLLIQPYNDFIASGELKDWTRKLDTSKEIVVKDTTTLQKKTIHFSDLEDEDLYNKSIKERYPNANVLGHIRIDEFGNEFASGELKNQSIFSPYINGQVFKNEDEQGGTFLPNMTVQYEFSYENTSGNLVENKSVKTKPKLFYYSGTRTAIENVNGNAQYIYLHRASASSITALEFRHYPLCSPFDLTAASSATLDEDNQSLYWNATPPLVGNLTVFNYDINFGSWFNNTLYGKYWKPYLDNIYSDDARIMECYLNLTEVDIFDFSFSDEYFIKDSYWRVLNISNYQVGGKASTKVTLIKSLDTKVNCNNCDQVIGTLPNGSNTWNNIWTWCDEDDPGCTPSVSGAMLGILTTPECCTCNGGMILVNSGNPSYPGLFACYANAGSLPLTMQSIFGNTALFNPGQLKSIVSGKLGGTNRPLITGVDNTKSSTKILNYYGDDIVIKYRPKTAKIPQYRGESHRMVFTGYTEGNTRGYAYPSGDKYGKPLYIPDNINMIIRVKGISTVVGGTSSTYPLGTTDAVAYYTAFVVRGGEKNQVGVAGGEPEFQIREGVNPVTCTLHIDIDSDGVLKFGLDDSQTDTKRLWTLTADIDINRLDNMLLGYKENWALYQNGSNIQFQNYDYLIWN